jgi:calmodulin-regulated spectrin-associated protein
VLEDKKENKHKELPKFEKLNSLEDVKDGASILAVFSYFHPQTVPWTDIDFSRGNKSAAFNNFNTIKTAAKKTLPYDIMHIQFIDLFNSEVDMKRNILCFLLDMINRL